MRNAKFTKSQSTRKTLPWHHFGKGKGLVGCLVRVKSVGTHFNACCKSQKTKMKLAVPKATFQLVARQLAKNQMTKSQAHLAKSPPSQNSNSRMSWKQRPFWNRPLRGRRVPQFRSNLPKRKSNHTATRHAFGEYPFCGRLEGQEEHFHF